MSMRSLSPGVCGAAASQSSDVLSRAMTGGTRQAGVLPDLRVCLQAGIMG